MGDKNYTAINSPGAAVGKENLLQGNTVTQTITIGPTPDDRKAQAELIALLISAIRKSEADDVDAKTGAEEYLGKVQDELIEEEKPDSTRISKWLGKAKDFLSVLGKTGEIYDKAKDVFASFELPW